jgi:hypothetical protein
LADAKTRIFFAGLILCLGFMKPVGKVEIGFAEEELSSPPMPTGIISLADYHHPAALYVPENYKPDRAYACIVSLPSGGESPEEHIRFWSSIAKRRSMIVLTPANLLRPGTEPQRMDEWLMRLLGDVSVRYRVDKQKTFLAGVGGEAAHYAAYLGINYPDKFSAVLLLGGSWGGYLEQMMSFSSDVRKQIPFYVAFEASAPEEAVLCAENEALHLEKKGYTLSLTRLDAGASFADTEFKGKALDWMNQKSEDWRRQSEESGKNWKQKLRRWWDRNINP